MKIEKLEPYKVAQNAHEYFEKVNDKINEIIDHLNSHQPEEISAEGTRIIKHEMSNGSHIIHYEGESCGMCHQPEECPKCGGKKDPQHPNCWHCINCPYTKCADEVFEPEVKEEEWIEDFDKWYDSYEEHPPKSSILGYFVRKIKQLNDQRK